MKRITITFNDDTIKKFEEAQFVDNHIAIEYVPGFINIKEKYGFSITIYSYPSSTIKEIKQDI